MSKVICDVCGTSFPETATNCPICGCAKQPDAPVAAEENNHSASNNYGKGGRFSKENVRRNSRPRSSENRSSEGRFSKERKEKHEPEESNKGLIAVVIILLIAIVAVVAYIGVNVFFNDLGGNGDQSGNQNASTPADNNQNQTIACTSVKFPYPILQITEEKQYLLAPTVEPADTTDEITYESSDPTIVTVDENGLLIPVGYGEATVTVTCGSFSDTMTVLSEVGEPPVTTEPTTPPVTLPAGYTLVLETYKGSGEITIAAEGDSHKLYKEIMGVAASDITWTTSDPSVATVVDGKVTGVDRGTCTITATIGDQTATCLVRCPFDAAEPTPYQLSQGSATIAKGETFTLSLKDKETGANVQGIEWHASIEGVVSINGNKITGGTVSKLTAVDVYTEHDGVTYTCKVYVKAPEA